MSKYRGLFTFDEDNHRYVPIALADGIICEKEEDEMSSAEDSILEEEIREGWWGQGEAVMKEMCDEDG